MKKIIPAFSLLLVIFASLIINLKIEKELFEVFSKIKIENIGESLQAELIRMNVDGCEFTVRKDGFFFFQNKTIDIKNSHKCLRINTRYIFLKSIFKIEGFQTWY